MYMNGKKLLIITPYMPYPLDGGGTISQFEINDTIRNFVDITLIFPVNRHQIKYLEELEKRWPNVLFEPYFPSKFERIKHLIWKTIYYGWYHRCLAMLRFNKAHGDDLPILKSTTI